MTEYVDEDWCEQQISTTKANKEVTVTWIGSCGKSPTTLVRPPHDWMLPIRMCEEHRPK